MSTEGKNEEKTEIGLELISKALILFGGIILAVHIVLYIFSGSALQQGWEYVWFLPRSQFSTVPIISVLIILSGIILYVIHFQLQKTEEAAEESEEGET